MTSETRRSLVTCAVGYVDEQHGSLRRDKKQKVVIRNASSSSATPGSTETPAPTTYGLQPLDSIPFSLASFKESLTEEEKRLLDLECETMGKSW